MHMKHDSTWSFARLEKRRQQQQHGVFFLLTSLIKKRYCRWKINLKEMKETPGVSHGFHLAPRRCHPSKRSKSRRKLLLWFFGCGRVIHCAKENKRKEEKEEKRVGSWIWHFGARQLFTNGRLSRSRERLCCSEASAASGRMDGWMDCKVIYESRSSPSFT